jgi:hypothetical protein
LHGAGDRGKFYVLKKNRHTALALGKTLEKSVKDDRDKNDGLKSGNKLQKGSQRANRFKAIAVR